MALLGFLLARLSLVSTGGVAYSVFEQTVANSSRKRWRYG